MIQVFLTGRLGADSELKTVGQTQVLNFSLAANVGYGEKKSTVWFKCAIWGDKRGQALERFLRKGQQVAISGDLSQETFKRKDGTEGTALRVRVGELDLVGGNINGGPGTKESQPTEFNEDDIPF